MIPCADVKICQDLPPLQKAVNRNIKGRLLRCKRRPFARQKAMFRTAACNTLTHNKLQAKQYNNGIFGSITRISNFSHV